MECSNFGCAVLGNKVYVVGGALVDDRGCSVGEFPETVHPFGFAFDPISEVPMVHFYQTALFIHPNIACPRAKFAVW